MSMGHMGERMFDYAKETCAGGALLGLVIGAIVGWPRSRTEYSIGSIKVTTYHNAFTDGEFGHVLEVGIFATGVITVLLAGLGYALVQAYNSSKGKPTPAG